MTAKHAVLTALATFLICSQLTAQCTPEDPAGHFEGSAVSQQAGKLDIVLDLRCANHRYEGELATSVGTFTLKTGTFENGEMQLHLQSGADSLTVKAKLEGDLLHGQFTLGDDSGPVELHRAGDAHPSESAEDPLHLTAAQWLEDVDVFSRELPRKHANGFQQVSQDQFNSAVAELKQSLPHANSDEIYVGLDRIANAIGDAHTYVEFPTDAANLPLDARQIGTDYRILAVGAEFEKALGARILKIGQTPVSRAREMAAAMTPATDTEALKQARIDDFLTMGITLHGLGIAPDRDHVTYTLADDEGHEFTVTFTANHPGTKVSWVYVASTQPLFRQNAGENFWYTYLPESHTLYCNFRGYDGLDKHAQGLLREVKEKKPGKLIIDLRQNSGGDYKEGLKRLIGPVRDIPEINRHGHLFVLIGVNTFSAAMSNAAQFRQQTAAILVGEPVGERPNSYQEPREFRLPNSHLVVRYSTQYYEFAKGSDNIIRPDQEVSTHWEDYKTGRDPVLEWVLQYK